MPVFKDSEQQQQCLEEVETAAKSMGNLLDNLLFLARHEGPMTPAYIRADGQLLQRAISNLLDNALKYTPPKGNICLRCFTQSHHAVIQVEDNGVGIPETDLPHIFDRFYRVDVARSRQTGGFGLGLSIAQQIVQAHGGQIRVKSVFGQGTTFDIEVPLCPSRSKAA